MSSLFYVYLAYGVTYVALLWYTFYLVRRRARAHDVLQAQLQRPEE